MTFDVDAIRRCFPALSAGTAYFDGPGGSQTPTAVADAIRDAILRPLANRGHNTIVVYSMDNQTGTLALVEHVPTQGKIPRGFGIDPEGNWLLAANQESDSVVVFRIDLKSGRLAPTGQTIEVGAPVSVVFVPAK